MQSKTAARKLMTDFILNLSPDQNGRVVKLGAENNNVQNGFIIHPVPNVNIEVYINFT